LADWQHTRWGMSVSEVVTSSAGEAAPVKGTDGDQVRGQDLGAEGTYDAGGFSFRSQFYFSPISGGLSAIRLHPDDQRACPLLEREIRAVYSASGRSEYYSAERNL